MVRRYGATIGLLAAALVTPAPAAGPERSPVTIRELVEMTDVDSVAVSPDGRFALFRTVRADVSRNSHVLRWFCADLDDGTVRDVGSGGDPIASDPGLLLPEKVSWGADGRTVVVRRLVDGAIGLWRGDVGGGGWRPLAVGDADVIDQSMTADRESVTYHVGATRDEIRRAEQREYDEGILVDATVDLSQGLYRGGLVDGRMASQRLVGYWTVRDGLLWRTPRQERRVDLRTGADVAVGARRAVPSFDLATYLDPDPAGDGPGTVAAASGRGGRTLEAIMKDGRRIACRDLPCRSLAVSWSAWRPGSEEVVVAFKDRHFRQSLYRWDTGQNRLILLAASQGLLSGSQNDFRPCAVSSRFAVCVAAGPSSPPLVERIDLATGTRTVLLDPNAGFRAAYRPAVRFLRFPIGQGQEVAAVVMTPAGQGRRPAPLYLNYNRCEGFLRGGQGNEWPIPQMLDAGYTVACIDAVPLDGPQDAVRNYQLGLSAVRALVDALSGEGLVDRSKVAMGGLSFGSEAAFWVAVRSRLLAALSVSSPQLEPADYWRRALSGSDMPAAMLKVWGLGPPDRTAARWRKVSPALNAGKVDIPVLFQMPEQEARQGPELYARLAAQGTPTELYAFPDEGHIKVQPRHRAAIYERNLDWFRYWLEGYRDPGAGKAAQYARWDALRTRWTRVRPGSRTASTAPSRPSR